MLLKACLNGVRTPDQHPALPVTPDQIGAEAAAAVAAGAMAVHAHPKGPDGRDSLRPEHADAVVRALRAAVPGTPVGLTTGGWAEPDPQVRAGLVAAWAELPDFASVNWHEPGGPELAGLLLDRGIGVEAGLWHAAAAEAFARWPRRGECLRVMVEPQDETVAGARATVAAVLAATEGLGPPRLVHGLDGTAWPLLADAVAAGLDTRIGLEDVLVLPDGSPAPGNAALVAAAAGSLP